MRCLIIDDDPITRRLLASMMVDYFSCEEASDGEEGLAKFIVAAESNSPFDVILLDVKMPAASGVEVLAAIRDREAHQDVEIPSLVPVVMITGDDSLNTFVDSNALVCSSYISKPVNRDRLFSELRRVGVLPDDAELT